MVRLSVFVGLVATVGSVDPSAMSKVIALLTNMKESTIKSRGSYQTNHETKLVNINAMLDNARNSLQRANTLATTNSALQATCEANIKELTSSIDQDTIDLTTNELNLKNEQERRTHEASQWDAEKTDLQQGLEAVRQAITTLDALQEAHGPNTALIQASGAPNKEDMEKMMAAVSTVIESVKVNFASKKDLDEMAGKPSKSKAFLQQAQVPGRNGPQNVVGPQHLGLENAAGISNVLGKLRDMSHEIQGLISEGNAKEQEADQVFKLFKQQNEFTQTALKESVSADNKAAASERAKLEAAMATLAESNQQIHTDQILIDELTRQLSQLAKSSTERLQSFSAEVRVMDDAINMIKSSATYTPAYFLQLKAQATGRIDPDIAKKVQESLNKSADKMKSTVLSQLANKVGSGMSFARLIKLMNQMINTLKQGLKDLDSRDKWCKEELKNTFETFESWELKEKTLQLQWNVAAADVASKQQLLANLADDNSKAQAARVTLAQNRNDEKAAYAANKQANADYIKALEQVLADLSNFYSAEVQTAEGTAASSLMALLRQILQDLQTEGTQIELDEVQAEEIYRSTDNDLAASIALRDNMIKETDRQLVGLHTTQQDVQADLGDTKEALVAAADSKQAVQDGCERSNEMTTEEKQAQLQAEIAALKDAMAILES